MFRNVNKGQASLIMILILAVAFVFYAISLNWTKIANLKTSGWMTSVNIASQGASMFASYGERVVHEQLYPLPGHLKYNGGRLESCDDGFWMLQFKILVIVIVLVITILTYGATSPLLCVVVGVLLTAALVIEYAVIRPMTFSIWNKLNSNLRPVDQFRESPMVAGLQTLVNDSVTVPDRFDLDANGKWGFSGTVANDNIGRFSLYYTERLKTIKPPNTSAYEAFKEALNNLITRPPQASQGALPTAGLGFAAYCNSATNLPYNSAAYSPQCDPMCTGILGRPVNMSTLEYVPTWVVDPFGLDPPHADLCRLPCSSASNPNTCPNFSSKPALPGGNVYYPLSYDPTLERDPIVVTNPADGRNSFRFRLGHDDEIHTAGTGYAFSNDPNYVTGVIFPMLYQMDQANLSPSSPNLANPSLSPAAASFQTMFSDELLPPANFRAADTICAQDPTLTVIDPGTGFNWKKGADRYCSDVEGNPVYQLDPAYSNSSVSYAPTGISAPPNFHYPYFHCPYMLDGAGNPQPCLNGPGAAQWPQDNIDAFIYGLGELIKFNKMFQGMDSRVTVESVDVWYGQLQPMIAPKCGWSSYNATGVDNFVRNNPRLAYMADYADDPSMCNTDHQGAMLQWLYEMSTWANQLNDPATGWLNQVYPAGPTSVCSGNITDIINCLAGKTLPLAQVTACNASLPTGLPSFPYSLSTACSNVLAYGQATPADFFTVAPVVSNPLGAADYNNFRAWITDNRILMQTSSDRRDLLARLKSNAEAVVALFNEGTTTLGAFMDPNGPIEEILKTIRDHKNANDRLPSFIIYGWRDQKITTNNQASSDGLWHLARVEDKQPSVLPWVRIHTKGLFHETTCYNYQDGDGNVWVRATRWDDSLNGGLVRFANGTPIWQFRSVNPKITGQPLSYGASDLATRCQDASGLGFGLTKEMTQALQTSMASNPAFPANPEEAKAYREAFMLNIDPRRPPLDGAPYGGCTFSDPCSQDPASYQVCCANAPGFYGTQWIQHCVSKNVYQCKLHTKRVEFNNLMPRYQPCWDAATDLLRSGVQSYSGARYGVPPRSPFHLGIFMHNERTVKSKNYFDDFTFNDAPINP